MWQVWKTRPPCQQVQKLFDVAFGEDDHWGVENAEEPADPLEVDDGTDGEEVHPSADPLQELAREPTPSSTNASVVRYIYIFICLCLFSCTKDEM